VKVSEAKFTRRYNTGNYESEEYSLTAIVEEDESAVTVLGQLKADVDAAHAGEEGPLPDAGQDEGEETGGKPPKKPSKKSKDKPTTTRGGKAGEEEDDDADTDADSDSDDVADDDATDDDDAGGEEDDDGKKPGKKTSTSGGKSSTATTGKKFRSKTQVYQRGNDTHKELFSGVLKDVAPSWKKTDESKALAKKASIKMEGKDFLDADGEVFPSFKELVRKFMKGGK
jgi:hypothetical protein